jgi:hypothetical protein
MPSFRIINKKRGDLSWQRQECAAQTPKIRMALHSRLHENGSSTRSLDQTLKQAITRQLRPARAPESGWSDQVPALGTAAATSGCLGGGHETTVMALLQMLLVHGMIVQGSADGDHYGPVAVGAPDERACGRCVLLDRRVAELALKLER